MVIKAIETRYNGYRFRSRLEARWAVFFDALEIEYQYEPEGFDLEELGWYLPDFFIPGWKTWFEIKPVPLTNAENNKCLMLSKAARQQVIALCGNVWPFEHSAVTYYDGELQYGPGSSSFGQCRKCSQETWLEIKNQAAFCLTRENCDHDRYPLCGKSSSLIFAAYKAARSARFEHGETP